MERDNWYDEEDEYYEERRPDRGVGQALAARGASAMDKLIAWQNKPAAPPDTDPTSIADLDDEGRDQIWGDLDTHS